MNKHMNAHEFLLERARELIWWGDRKFETVEEFMTEPCFEKIPGFQSIVEDHTKDDDYEDGDCDRQMVVKIDDRYIRIEFYMNSYGLQRLLQCQFVKPLQQTITAYE